MIEVEERGRLGKRRNDLLDKPVVSERATVLLDEGRTGVKGIEQQRETVGKGGWAPSVSGRGLG